MGEFSEFFVFFFCKIIGFKNTYYIQGRKYDLELFLSIGHF